ncbi:hypothetical protein B9Z55_018192 [Caenorhabditis nigoni]|nr:hypothetical protein B9Z55_018192 [Caenorhabditis nigoni]
MFNIYLIYTNSGKKNAQKKMDLTLIYYRFVVDFFQSSNLSIYLYYMLHTYETDQNYIKNFPFYVAWPNFQLGTIRCWLVFSIGLDRVLATCTPIFYHNNRSKFPLSGVFLFIVAYALLENYILFVHCDFEIDIPLDCNTFRCAIETCYHNYWKWYQQIMYVLIGTLSIILFFRLFIWNNCKKGAKNKAISRATWISLLDSFIIFAFDFFPVFLTAQWPDINTKTVGPLGSLCKQLGLVIESFVVCNVLLNKKVVPITRSQTSPTNFPVVY